MNPTRRTSPGYGIILGSFFVAFVLSVLPMPDWSELFRPEWVLMTLIYWVIALPQRIGVIVAWCIGLLVDVLEGSLLGEQALALAMIAYVGLLIYRPMRVFPLWQQSLVIFVLLGLNQLIVLALKLIFGKVSLSIEDGFPILVSMLVWPWLFIVLRELRQHYQIN